MKAATPRRWRAGARFQPRGGELIFRVERITENNMVVYTAINFDREPGTRKTPRVRLYREMARGRLRWVTS